MQIKVMSKEDRLIASQLIEKTIRTVNSKFYPEEIVESAIRTYSDFEKKGETVRFIVMDNNKAIGTIGLEKNKICGLFIDPEFQKKGIGKKLMEKAENEVEKNGYCEVVLSSSLNAIDFYKKLGYIWVAKEYSEILGETICMKKSLK